MSDCARCRSKLPPLARFCSECGAWATSSVDSSASGDAPSAPLASFYAPAPPLPPRAVVAEAAVAPTSLAAASFASGAYNPASFAATAFEPGSSVTAVTAIAHRASLAAATVAATEPASVARPAAARPPSAEPPTLVSPHVVVRDERRSFRPGQVTQVTQVKTAERHGVEQPSTGEAERSPPPPRVLSVPTTLATMAAIAGRSDPFAAHSSLPALPPRFDAGGTVSVLPDRPSVLSPGGGGAAPTASGSALVPSPATAPDPQAHLPTPARSVLQSARPLGGFLVSFQYEPLGAFWPLADGTNLLGRVGARPDLDVGINDATISSEHAILTISRPERSDQGLSAPGATIAITLDDRGSRNGTFVNGVRIPSGGRCALAHGDRVRLGGFESVVVVLP